MDCGIGIRPELFAPVFDNLPKVGFMEAHSENYFGESIARAKLLELREHYPISLHGVGLSLGRADHLDDYHLKQLKLLVEDVDPLFVSEHLAWSAYSHRHLPDLLPLPLTEESLQIMCDHIDQMQTALRRQVLVENPSNYLVFDQLQISEPEFLNMLASRTGCGLLLDVNNVHVSSSNTGRDSREYIDELNTAVIEQYHLAGYTPVVREANGQQEQILIDTHNQTVYPPVWELFEHTLKTHGQQATLFEWDSDFPEFQVILDECEKANKMLIAADRSRAERAVSPAPSSAVSPSLSSQQDAFLASLLSLQSRFPGAQAAYQHRIGVYQNNVFSAIQDYMAEVFPATKGVLGPDYYKQLVQTFIQQQPPSQGNINLYGQQLSDLLGDHAALDSLPYLTALMEYEWSLHEAYFASTTGCIDPAAQSQDELLRMPMTLNESVFLLSSEFPIYQIHRQSLPDYDGEVNIDLSQSQDHLLIYKSGFEVKTEVLSSEQTIVFDSIQNNDNLLQAIEALQGSISAETMSSTLALVLEHRMLVATS